MILLLREQTEQTQQSNMNIFVFGIINYILILGSNFTNVSDKSQLQTLPNYNMNYSGYSYQNTFVNNISKLYVDRQLYGSMTLGDDVMDETDEDIYDG